MRTTITLDSDVHALLKKRMKERGTSFKRAVNDAVREGLTSRPQPEPFKTRSWDLGLRPGIDLTKANKLAGQLEDEHVIRRMHESEHEAD